MNAPDLTCPICGATGMTPCDLLRHTGSLLAFTVAMKRIDAMNTCRCAACINGTPFECIRRRLERS